MELIKKILKVIYTLLFLFLLVSAGFIILTSYKMIEGYNFYVVMSGSMEPNIRTGSVVGVKTESSYAVNDVVTIKMKNDPSQTYTHRIVNIEGETYTTKGDANESNDPDKAEQNMVIGKVIVNVPLLGYIVNFAKQPTGFLLMIILPTIVIISSELNSIKDATKEYMEKKKKVSSEPIEKDEAI